MEPQDKKQSEREDVQDIEMEHSRDFSDHFDEEMSINVVQNVTDSIHSPNGNQSTPRVQTDTVNNQTTNHKKTRIDKKFEDKTDHDKSDVDKTIHEKTNNDKVKLLLEAIAGCNVSKYML